MSSSIASSFASKLMVSITLSSAFLYADAMLSCRSLSHCVLSSLYRFVVLSTNMKALSEFTTYQEAFPEKAQIS